MAGKSKSGKKAKRIPKTIAGVRIPKDLRKSGEALIDHATSPQGRRMIAAGLAMAASAIATKAQQGAARHGETPANAEPEGLADQPVTRTARHRPEPPVAPVPPVPPVPSSPPAGEKPPLDPDRIVEAMSAATGAFFDGLFGRKR